MPAYGKLLTDYDILAVLAYIKSTWPKPACRQCGYYYLMSTIFSRASTWARELKRDIHALWFAARDPRTPWYVKLLALFVAAYALSPIDLIPDFIPVIGYLDDVVIVPLGVLLVLRLIPPVLMEEYRAKAAAALIRPVSRVAAAAFVAVWVVCAALAAYWVIRNI